jgi:hypothetical protein
MVAFLSGRLNLTGGTLNHYQYAVALKLHKNIDSVFLLEGDDSAHDPSAFQLISQRFSLIRYDVETIGKDLLAIYDSQPIKVFYYVTQGPQDPLTRVLKNLGLPFSVHVTGVSHDPWGASYAYVSEWMSNQCSAGTVPFVPHIVELPDTQDHLREQLGIDSSAIVVGRLGGSYSWNIHFVNDVIHQAANLREDLFFILINIPYFPQYLNHQRIKLYGSFPFDQTLKRMLINTCDAMIHARAEGESFGFAPAEFSVCNKPVITYRHSTEKAHLHMLGDFALTYESPQSLLSIFLSLGRNQKVKWNRYLEYNSMNVINKFYRVFYEPINSD